MTHWKAEGHEIWTDESHGSVKIAECVGWDAQHNAQRIVHAVNIYPALVEALTLCERALEQSKQEVKAARALLSACRA